MRITGGTLCGRKVEVPDGVIRPAMDRMRESVFAVLGDLTGQSFLDIFSGSGISPWRRRPEARKALTRWRWIRSKEVRSLKTYPSRRSASTAFMAAELYVRRAKKTLRRRLLRSALPYRFKRELVESIAASPIAGPGTLVLIHHPGRMICPKHRPADVGGQA
jgi:hypothetical protein